ncbi:hypothetical protein [Carboxydothermus hydrogenoformans]|uniref:Putative lipoprotein n=1 Tax=Carboxydothermus hydrogenoformans (strain ATCC BAA-161 / DSM 6008 / Z-2901) TaxID=246194 RepID=Q3AA88_CARHZ|nr:hypothetical protein [Carboxydothermus hydrogenoformans]ABB13911.1 putative lipoprotein [Carboxydothermus hydrogenoformans Z-2901]
MGNLKLVLLLVGVLVLTLTASGCGCQAEKIKNAVKDNVGQVVNNVQNQIKQNNVQNNGNGQEQNKNEEIVVDKPDVKVAFLKNPPYPLPNIKIVKVNNEQELIKLIKGKEKNLTPQEQLTIDAFAGPRGLNNPDDYYGYVRDYKVEGSKHTIVLLTAMRGQLEYVKLEINNLQPNHELMDDMRVSKNYRKISVGKYIVIDVAGKGFSGPYYVVERPEHIPPMKF